MRPSPTTGGSVDATVHPLAFRVCLILLFIYSSTWLSHYAFQVMRLRSPMLTAEPSLRLAVDDLVSTGSTLPSLQVILFYLFLREKFH